MDQLINNIKDLGDKIRQLKANPDTPPAQIEAAVAELLKLKEQLNVIQKEAAKQQEEKVKFREGVEDVLLRKFFYIQSFEIYHGVAGLYDYGPPGTAIMSNLQNLWRKHFVLTEQMLEVSCSSLTPEPVLKTSGHVDRFTDYLVYDTVTNEPYRADKILEDHIEGLMLTDTKTDEAYSKQLQADFNAAGSMKGPELDATLAKYGVTIGGNPISTASEFNLMFKTSIGPTGKVVGYLRPETAQGIFVNFRRLYEFNNRRLPFAGAQIGLAYRNEIAPRGGLLRVREFPMAEIEHFVHPDRKQHPKFTTVADFKAKFWTAHQQENVLDPIHCTFGDAVRNGLVNNETLGYFLGRTWLFLTKIGVNPDKIRFRQHRSTEMAHYAQDCWDAELHTTFGWIECVGHADRSAYDLRVHSEATKQELCVSETLDTPIIERKYVPKYNRGLIGRALRQKAAHVFTYLDTTSQTNLQVHFHQLETDKKAVIPLEDGTTVELTANELTISLEDQKRFTDTYIPHVIEPSFGLGRIIYSLLEHSYYVREDDEQRKVLRFVPVIAPFKVGLYNVVSNIPYQEILDKLRNDAIDLGIAYQEDSSRNSIGRKYSRGDEIGTPFAISIDSESVEKSLVTIRERDTCQQVQVHADEAMDIIHKLVHSKWSWDEVYAKYPHFTNAAAAE